MAASLCSWTVFWKQMRHFVLCTNLYQYGIIILKYKYTSKYKKIQKHLLILNLDLLVSQNWTPGGSTIKTPTTPGNVGNISYSWHIYVTSRSCSYSPIAIQVTHVRESPEWPLILLSCASSVGSDKTYDCSHNTMMLGQNMNTLPARSMVECGQICENNQLCG